MERIYHRYEFWECYKNGFFRNVSGDEKKKLANKVIELFTDSKLTEKYINKYPDIKIYFDKYLLYVLVNGFFTAMTPSESSLIRSIT
jgi:hypothetical protein